jgi:hypothetical protein
MCVTHAPLSVKNMQAIMHIAEHVQKPAVNVLKHAEAC